MSKKIKGTVVWVGDKKKYGNYSFKLEDHDEWFRSPGRCEGVLEKGNVVSLVVEENDRGDYDVKAKPVLVEEGSGDDKPRRGKSGGKSSGSSGGSSKYKEDPEKASRITVQASQKVALDTAKLLIEAGAVKLAKTKPEANKVIILDLMDELTAKFYQQVYDPEALIKERKAIDSEVEDGDEPEDADDNEDFESDVPWDED